MNAIAKLNDNLYAYKDRFQAVMPTGMLAPKLIETIVFACEANKKLMDCTLESLVRSGMTAANAGLVVDGWSGQGFLIPRKDHGVQKANFQPGYKGYITMAWRSRWIVTHDHIRENDEYELPTAAQDKVHHRILHQTIKERGRRIGSYAVAKHAEAPAVWRYLSMEELHKIRARSDAYKYQGNKSVWVLDEPAMCAKTVILDLCRRLPLDFTTQRLITTDEAVERGQFAWIDDNGGVVIEGEAYPAEQGEPDKSVGERLIDATTGSAA